jgi:transposase
VTSAAREIPEDVDALRALVLHQRAELAAQGEVLAEKSERIDTLAAQIRQLEEYVRLLKHHRFGRTSEKADPAQRGLFNEAEVLVDAIEKEHKPAGVEVAAHTRSPRGRKPLPDFLPRVEIVHDLPEAEKVCATDGTPLVRIGEETSEQLEIIPATIQVLRHVRPKYACPACHAGVHVAPPPLQPIPKSLASPALLAHVAVSKYVDALPLHRQETMLARGRSTPMRATLAHWMVRADELVQPLVNLLRDDLLASGVVQCDETPFQVLKEAGKPATSLSYLWVQRSLDAPVVLYDYDPSRSGRVPERLFEGFQGVLQTDGYEGYTAVGQRPGVVHAGCFAHARRKFDEALKGMRGAERKAKSRKESVALQGLAWIQKLYAIEKSAKDATPAERQHLRDERARPILASLRRWLDDALPRVAPQTLTGKALAYLDHQWPKLVRVLGDGRVPLDTNLVENAIRPFVVGRKNWLFSDTARGAHASANLFSVVETAKANDIEPFAYLRLVFTELPRATALPDFEALLPRNLDRSHLQGLRQDPTTG